MMHIKFEFCNLTAHLGLYSADVNVQRFETNVS